MEAIKNFFSKSFKINITSKNRKLEEQSKSRLKTQIFNTTTRKLEDENNYFDIEDSNECEMTFKELCQYNGFSVEEHDVKTKDNYILKIFRIKPPNELINGIYKQILKTKRMNILANKDVNDGIINNNDYICFFQHGLLDSSDGWICNFKNKCLPFIMANKGFEVWLGNSRGNKYSKLHSYLNPLNEEDQEKFFDYSFDELGKYDLPACFDYILNQKDKDFNEMCNNELDLSVMDFNETSNRKDTIKNILEDIPKPSKRIIYFGHSQGGASICSSMTQNIQYFQSVIKVCILLAPAVRVDNICEEAESLIDKGILDILKVKKIFEIAPYNKNLQSTSIIFNTFCSNLSMSMLERFSDEEVYVNCSKRYKIFFSHYPSGSSLRSFEHFAQMVKNKKFQSFDFKEMNLQKYNDGKVIQYDLEKIKGVPIILCGGGKDRLVNIENIRWLKDELLKNREKRKIISNKEKYCEEINDTSINNNFDCPLYSYYEFDMMGHLSFLINSDLSWFNPVLCDIFSIIKTIK